MWENSSYGFKRDKLDGIHSVHKRVLKEHSLG